MGDPIPQQTNGLRYTGLKNKIKKHWWISWYQCCFCQCYITPIDFILISYANLLLSYLITWSDSLIRPLDQGDRVWHPDLRKWLMTHPTLRCPLNRIMMMCLINDCVNWMKITACMASCSFISLQRPMNVLTHWGRDKMDAILQPTFSNAFSWMKMYQFRLRFHWSLFPRVKLTIFQHWFR